MSMEWISFDERLPEGPDEVLGCHWYCSDTPSIYVCEPEIHAVYSYGILTSSKALSVKNSICPKIGWGDNPHWMPIPRPDDICWKKFDADTWDWGSGLYRPYLIRLYNGGHYVASLDTRYTWSPTFSFTKFGSNESIDCYMDVPQPPERRSVSVTSNIDTQEGP